MDLLLIKIFSEQQQSSEVEFKVRNIDVFLQGPVLDNVYCVNTTCRLDSSASMID